MKKIYQYLLENTAKGKIDKHIAIEVIKQLKIEEVKTVGDIAIIGMAARFPLADDVNMFWSNIRSGKDCITHFPDSRREDIDDFLSLLFNRDNIREYHEGGFLVDIDKFDYEFFKLSPKEAGLMDPNQRLLLQIIWQAIEDAGYGGRKLTDTKTGVYLGYSSDFGESYKSLIQLSDPSSVGLATVGNIKSVIASRISYILDLKGPSMLIDTACSSSLVAVHLACCAIRSGECDMALAGGIKINLTPIKPKEENRIGIESSIWRARTFDEMSDGTGLGEGVGVVFLKPLKKAIQDRDNIYAIIKGSAANQDGMSIGLTSPNSEAQSEVILKAWENSRIEPETISYIEAHGTGTKLGDPIEIEGIKSAFRKHTEKKQFCAVGSVKTNIGHLDSAAGIASLIKAVLAIKNKELPPSVHFLRPNRKIDFENSPVYISDSLAKWESDGSPKRCGISSFGLSGTNCHVVLEEPPICENKECEDVVDGEGNIFTLSAKNIEALKELLKAYETFALSDFHESIKDICYTANTGRGHYNYRLAMLIKDKGDFRDKINKALGINFGLSEFIGEDIYYGRHSIIDNKREKSSEDEIYVNEKRQLSKDIEKRVKEWENYSKSEIDDLSVHICLAYIKGADIEWNEIYKGQQRYRISLPAYTFNKKRCWLNKKIHIENHSELPEKYIKMINHPLVEYLLAESIDRDTYCTEFSTSKHWVLSEYKVNGNCTLPGTTYLEMIREIFTKQFATQSIEFRDVVFETPLVVGEGESREVQTIIKNEGELYEFIILSRLGLSDNWVRHSAGKVIQINENEPYKYELGSIVDAFTGNFTTNLEDIDASVIETGPRWNSIADAKVQGNKILAYIKIPEEFKDDLELYGLHPALMDCAANVAIRSIEDGVFLPFHYKKLKLYASLPDRFYSYLRTKGNESRETITFDITIIDEEGLVIAEIDSYTIKKVHEREVKTNYSKDAFVNYYSIGWIKRSADKVFSNNEIKNVLIFKNDGTISDDMIKAFANRSCRIIEVSFGEEFKKESESCYVITGEKGDYEKLFADLGNIELSHIVHLSTITGLKNASCIREQEIMEIRGVYSLFYLLKALEVRKSERKIEILLVSDYANEVSGVEEVIKPINAAFLGMGKAIGTESPRLICRCLDIDYNTTVDSIVSELTSSDKNKCISFRQGSRYIEMLKNEDIDKIPDRDFEIKEDGVYVVTGGIGGIGLEIAKHLSSFGRLNIALINRKTLPEREKWKEIIKEGKDKKLIDKISIINDIEKTGTKIVLFSADVSDAKEIGEVFGSLKKTYTKINGIFHCAGIAGDGFLIKKDEKIFMNVLAPKIRGTWNINRIIENDETCFLILFSSVSSIFRRGGQVDYAAANSYLGSFSAYVTKRNRKCLVINWPAWKETGMAVDYKVNFDQEFKAITTLQAITGLNNVLRKDIKRVIIGDLNLSDSTFAKGYEVPFEISENIKRQISKARDKSGSSNGSGRVKSDVRITGKKRIEEYTDCEKLIAQIWGELLEIEEVNVDDNFFELGGNSLLAVKLEIEMEKRGVDFQYSDIDANPTIRQLAWHISGKIDSIEDKNQNILDVGIDNVPENGTESLTEINDNKIHLKNLDIILNKEEPGIVKVLEGFKPFNDIVFKSCFYSAFFPIVRYYAKSINPFLANEAIYYKYVLDNGTRTFDLLSTPIIGLEQLAEGIGIYIQKKDANIDLISSLKASIESNKPVILSVDSYYESIRPDTFLKIHWPHNLLIHGYNEKRKEFNIIEHENRMNLSYKNCMISYSDLERAFYNYPDRYKNIDIVNSNINELQYTHDKKFPVYYEFSLNDENTLDYSNESIYTEKGCKINLIKQYIDAKELILSGMELLKEFKYDFEKIIMDEAELKENAQMLSELLSNIINTKKIELYRFVEIFGVNEEIQKLLEGIIGLWANIRSIILKFEYSSIYQKNNFVSLITKIDNIYIMEQEYYRCLFEFIQNNNDENA